MMFVYRLSSCKYSGYVEPQSAPVTLELPSIDEARKMIYKVMRDAPEPVHSLLLMSDDGKLAERWFQIDGRWRRKDA